MKNNTGHDNFTSINRNLVCEPSLCNGCRACANVCPKKAITIVDKIEYVVAEIDSKNCIECNLCKKMCPNNHRLGLKSPIFWGQGWASQKIRRESSSGGAASAIMISFIESGGYVASCLFKNGDFQFEITNNTNEVARFIGSKYVKSNPGNIYSDVKRLLYKGEKVLFIGLPCQSAAVQSVCGSNENLYTVDLICHGTPSIQLLKKYLEETGVEWNSISNISFRNKDLFGISNDKRKVSPYCVMDCYTMSFLRAINYTENCYSCRYASFSRVSDVTLGDAWGQMSETDPKGVSLILCQTEKGKNIVKEANIHIEDVDINQAVESNHQLSHPSIRHKRRDLFLDEIRRGHSYKRATFMAIPRMCIKASIITGLVKMKVIKDTCPPGGGSTV